MLVAAIGTYVTSSGAGRGWAVLGAALLSVGPAALFALAMIAAARWALPPVAGLAGRLALPRFVDRDPSAAREPVVMLHAAVIAFGLWLSLVVLASALVLMRLRSIESQELRETLSIVGVVGLATGAGLLAAASLWPLRRGFTALDRRVLLPWPASPALRAVLWLGLPVCLGATAALWIVEPALGPLALPLWIVLVLGVHCIVHAALTSEPARALLARVPRLGLAGKRLAWPVFVLLVALAPALALVAAHGVVRSEQTSLVLEEARPASMLLFALRGASDVDRDGASALFGEHDCAPFSKKRGPTVREIPGNGVDDNCDGKDSKRSTLPSSPTFFGALSPAEIKSYDIVWFIVDAMRADHTSLLGYSLETTPHLRALASESLVFSKAYSQSSATMLSIPSMLTGIDPGRLVWTLDQGRLQVEKSQRRYLSSMLESKGYQTGFVASKYFKLKLIGLLSGWDWTALTTVKALDPSTEAATLSAEFIVNAREKSAPFFLATYLVAPHSPYELHGRSYPKPRGAHGRYDAEIMHSDRVISFVLDMLRTDPERWAKTIVIVTADHGEEFKEHGGSTHARTCHVESLHVPLLMRVPGQRAAVIDRPVGLVDIVPTVLDLVGLNSKSRGLDGSSLLLATRAPERLAEERPFFCTVVSQKASQGNFARRSVQAGKWKLMSELRGSKRVALYDIEADPRERKPVALEGQAASTAARMQEWLNAQLTGNAHRVDMPD